VEICDVPLVCCTKCGIILIVEEFSPSEGFVLFHPEDENVYCEHALELAQYPIQKKKLEKLKVAPTIVFDPMPEIGKLYY
jgi:hypothetical protein